MTEARHGWRKNSKDTNVVCIGLKNYCVLKAIHFTRQEETCAQKHEMYGTRKIYEYFESCKDGCGVDVRLWKNSYGKNNQQRTKTTHGMQLKPSQKEYKSVTAGAKCNHGKTWHQEIEDKVESIKPTLIQQLTQAHTYTHARMHACIHPFTISLSHTRTYLLTYLLTHSLTHSYIYLCKENKGKPPSAGC